ncbi:Protein JBTS17 [Amphibalanus amphitrite]|uniref:Protein JBTS17 n=1 Tax=Amphibalanus amphitrite TaxID=1232801 RepID=A0A6A4VLZ8_AMPAM|nr:Protein JBTS17 [Amphibalanus amphitrite]
MTEEVNWRMHLVVEILSEAAIKHKKPYPALEWLGNDSESIFLLDGGRTCVLQLPSGGTKKHALRYRALHERLRAAVSVGVSPGGAFLAGTDAGGRLFAWHRDSNTLRTVPPPDDFPCLMALAAPDGDRESPPLPAPPDGSRLLTPRLFVDAAAERALLVRPAGGLLLLWEDGRAGRWSMLSPPGHVPLPDTRCKETAVDVAFSREGDRWARCSLVFGSQRGLVVSSVTLRWRPAPLLLTDGQPRFSAHWSSVTVAWERIHPRAELVRHSGALLARYSRGGRLLAVAVNQRHSDLSRLVYLGGGDGGGAVLVADLHGVGGGELHRRHQRQFWVAGLSWLAGDALLAAVTKQGSLAVLSALAEPVPLLLAGAEGSGRPAPYLELHRLLTDDSSVPEPEPAGGGPESSGGGPESAVGGPSPLSSARSAARPLRQRFSVATHPRRPVLLCSSGYLVTLAEVKWHALCSVCSPLAVCDRFISSATERLAALKLFEDSTVSRRRRSAATPSSPALKRRSAAADPVGRSPAKRVWFADGLQSEAGAERWPESAAHWDRVRALCSRLMAAQALVVSRPGRCTQEWAGRAAGVARLASQLAALALAGGCGRLGGPLVRLQRLLPLLGRLAALAAFSDSGGHVTLASAGVLAALVEGGLQTCRRLPAEEALLALTAMCAALRSAEQAQRRADQATQCVDPLDRQQAAALFAVTLPAGNPCSAGAVATLSSLWQRLLRAAGRLYSQQRGRLTADQHRRLAILLGELQACVQRRGRPLAAARLPRRTPVLRRYLAGDWAGTETRLQDQLDSALAAGSRGARRAGRPALGLLYLHVAGGRLRRALETADAALRRCAAGAAGPTAELWAALRHPAGRRLLHSLARLMARYHLAAPLSVPPPHAARPQPPLTDNKDYQHSVVPREMLTADISTNYLMDFWNPQQALKLLVCCGLLSEAFWFARELGDWRTALLICVLNDQLPGHRRKWPESLSAERLLLAQAASYLPLPAASLEERSVRRLLLAALLAGVPLVPPMLAGLARLLREPLRRLPCLVPAEQPLPAPPLYLAAAALPDSGAGAEQRARREVADAAQKVLSVLRAAGLLERCTLHYLTALRRACQRRNCEQAFRAPTLDASLEGTLRQLGAQLSGEEADPDGPEDGRQGRRQVADAAEHLRHLCLLLYLLQARDRLSSALRAQTVPLSSLTADSALLVVSLTATLRPLAVLPAWSADLAALALEAALGSEPEGAGRLVVPLAQTLSDLTTLSDGNRQRLRRLLRHWGDDRAQTAADGRPPAQHAAPAGSGAEQLLDSCRLQQLQPKVQLSLLTDGDALFACPADPSPLETQPEYLSFLRTMLDVAAPAAPVITPAKPLLAGWRSWHKRNELTSPVFLAGYRKMVAVSGAGDAGEDIPAAASASKADLAAEAPRYAGLRTPGAPAAGDARASGRTVRLSRSAERLDRAATPARRGLFRCVSFSDVWRPTGGDEEFLLAGGETQPRRQRRAAHRTRSADAALGRERARPSGRSWQTLPRQRAEPALPEPGAKQGGGGDGIALRHPALRLAKGVSAPQLEKYRDVEKLLGWFLLWRHREIRMDLVKSFSGPRIALRPTMPDVLVYIWLTDHMPRGPHPQGRGRSAPARNRSGTAPAAMAPPGGPPRAPDSSSSDEAMMDENVDDDPMMRHRGELMRRGGGNRGYGGYDGYGREYGAPDPRQYGRPNTAMPGYRNQGGQRPYQADGNRYQGNRGSPAYPRRMGNRGYDSAPNDRYGPNREPDNFNHQRDGQRYGEPDYGRRGYEEVGSGRRSRYGSSQYRPYERSGGGGGHGGSAPPGPGRRGGPQQVRFDGAPASGRADKWGSWDDFRAAPVSVRAGRTPSRSFSAQPQGRGGSIAPRSDPWDDNTRTLVSPPGGGGRPPPEPPAGWERSDRGGRRSAPPPPPPLDLPAGTAPGWDKTLHAVRIGAAGAQWKQMHGLDKVEGDECYMVYDDKIVRMENFTADSGATIDVVEKVAVYSPTGSARAGSGGTGRAPVGQPAVTAAARGRDGAPCVDCDWQPWSASNLSGQRQAQSAPPARSAAVPSAPTLQVPRSAASAGGKGGCVDCGEWQHWSASTLKSASPAADRPASPRAPLSERGGSAGAAPSRSDMSMSRQSELSERSDLISQLSDEVRQLREEQRHLRRELAARSPMSDGDVNIPQLTQIIDQINDALEVGLARLQRGQPWQPRPIHAPASLQPYVQAMKLPAPLLNAIVYDPESHYTSHSGSRSASRPGSGRSDAPAAAGAAEPDAGYRRLDPEQISQLVAEEVRKALREAAGAGSAGSAGQRRRPRSTSPGPAREIIVHQPVRRTHSHDPNSATPPTAGPGSERGSRPASERGSERRSSRSSSPPALPSASVGTYDDYPFLLHLEDGGAAEQLAARQVRAIQESPTARKIVQLLRDTDPAAPGGEPDLVDRVLTVHKRNLGNMYDKKADNMRVIKLLHDLSEDEEKTDHRAAQEIQQLDDEIVLLKRTLRALDSTEKLAIWRTPSDELRYLQQKLRQMDGSPPPADDVGAAEEVVVTGPDGSEHQFVSEGTGSECKVKQPRKPDGKKHTLIVYDTDLQKPPERQSVVEGTGSECRVKQRRHGGKKHTTIVHDTGESAAAAEDGHSSDRPAAARTPSPKRKGRGARLPGADGHMDVDVSEEEAPPPPQRVHRRFVPSDARPDAARSTPDATTAEGRRAAPRVSQSVFETTRAYQTSGEDRYIRPEDLEQAPSAPLVSSSTAEEIELGSYSVAEAARHGMARPATTRDALGLAEGHDAAQQMSRDRVTRTDGQQTGRRSPSPPARTVETARAPEPGGPPVPSSTVPSEPTMRTVPSWGRQTDSAAGVTDSMLKSYPSYLPSEQRRPVAEEEHVLEIGPIQVGISPQRIADRLADIGTKLGQAVGLVEQQQREDDEVRQVLEQLGGAPSGTSADSLQPFSSALSEPSLSMKQLLEQRLQQPPSSLDVMYSAQDTLLSADECDIRWEGRLAEKKKRQLMKGERKKKKERQKDASKLLTEITAQPKKPPAERVSPPAHWISSAVEEENVNDRRSADQQRVEQQQQKQQTGQHRQQTGHENKQQTGQKHHTGQHREDGGWFAVGVNAIEHALATSPEEDQEAAEEEASERELASWLPFSGGAPFGSEEPGDWSPFQTRQSPVSPLAKAPATYDQSDYGHGGFFTPGIRGSTGNIQQKRVQGAVPGKAIREKSSSIAQVAPKTAKRPKSGWDRSTDGSVAPSESAAERRLRRGSLHGPVRPTDDRRRNRADKHPPDSSSSSLSSGTEADDERARESAPRRKASPARRRPTIRRPGQRPNSAASSRTSDPADGDDDDELSSWRVPSVVFRLLGEGGTSSSDETNPATDQLLYSIFGKDI